jgi:hypothetical protein
MDCLTTRNHKPRSTNGEHDVLKTRTADERAVQAVADPGNPPLHPVILRLSRPGLARVLTGPNNSADAEARPPQSSRGVRVLGMNKQSLQVTVSFSW